MVEIADSDGRGLRRFLPPPSGFDALTASKRELARYGLPQRPDPRQQPGPASLWEQRAHRYRDFDHLEAKLLPFQAPVEPTPAALGLFPGQACGFELTSLGAPFVMVSATWNVPNLNHAPTPVDPVYFRTFFGLGFLDVHVEMTVNAAQSVTAAIRIHTGDAVAMAVGPGDVISAILCLQTDAAGTAAYFLANETTGQTTNFTMDTGFPPAVTVNAGISRGRADAPFNPLARFGLVYFDELSAFSTNGTRSLTDGVPTTMVGSGGSALAMPVRLNDFAFKVVHAGS